MMKRRHWIDKDIEDELMRLNDEMLFWVQENTHGYSLTELSNKTLVPKSYLSMLFREDRFFTFKVFVNIMYRLGWRVKVKIERR